MLIPKKVRIHLNLIALTRELCTNRLYCYLTVPSRSNYNNPLVFRNNGQFPIYTKVSLLAKRIETSFFSVLLFFLQTVRTSLTIYSWLILVALVIEYYICLAKTTFQNMIHAKKFTLFD